MVKKYIVEKPLDSNSTPYRIFLEEHAKEEVEKGRDEAAARKEARGLWDNLSKEERKEYAEKRKENIEKYENLTSKGATPYTLYIKSMSEEAREKGKTLTFKEHASNWKKLKESAKEKYVNWAEEIKEDRDKHKHWVELATGVKPKKPLGAYKFFLMEAAKDGKFEGKNPLSEGAKLWKKMNASDKEKYVRMAQKEKLAYVYKTLEFKIATKKINTGTKAKSAYNFFVSDQAGKAPSDLKKGGYLDYCIKKWNKLDDAGKRKYVKLAEDSKKEADKMKEEVKSRIFAPPKRAPSVIALFIQDKYEEIKSANKNKENTELFEICQKEWRNSSTKEKERYKKLQEKEAAIQEKKAEQYEQLGYYVDENMEKSSEKKKRTASKKSRSSSAGKRKKNKNMEE